MTIVARVHTQCTGSGVNGNTSGNIDTSANSVNFIVAARVQFVASGFQDSLGNTWSDLTFQAFTGASGGRLSYVAAPTVGAAQNFSTTGTGSYAEAWVQSFSGVAASPFDQENGGSVGASTTIQPGSVTPSQDNCVVVQGVGGGSTVSDPVSPTINSPYTLSEAFGGITGVAYAGGIAYVIQTAAGATNPTWDWTVTRDGVAYAASFKASAAAAGLGALLSNRRSYLTAGLVA